MSAKSIEILDLLQAPDLLDSYLAGIHVRREAGREQRLRTYWQTAIERLEGELASVVEEGDVQIAEELEHAIATFHWALASPPGHDPSTAPVFVPSQIAVSPAAQPQGETTARRPPKP